MKDHTPRSIARSRPLTDSREHARSFAMLVLLLFAALWSQHALAQFESCSRFEADGEPGYTSSDFYLAASQWARTNPELGDYDEDGRVTILDLSLHGSCVGDLSHGLLGRYYGLADGSEEQSLEVFPDMNALEASRQANVVRVAPNLYHFDENYDFMKTGFFANFAAIYTGMLYVPETADYTLAVYGNEGLRVYLDGSLVVGVDGWPRDAQATIRLEEGLHPFRAEYYSDRWGPEMSLTWSSNGQIGPAPVTIDPEYFFHETFETHANSISHAEILFHPESGSRVTSAEVEVSAFALSPDSRLSLSRDGQTLELRDGLNVGDLQLEPGLNRFTYTLLDADGRQVEKDYYLYYDAETLDADGLSARWYAVEWYTGKLPVPDEDGLMLVKQSNHDDFALVRDGDERVYIGEDYLGRGSVVELSGVIEVPADDVYTFRIDGQTGLWINGEYLCGIGAAHAREWNPENEVELSAGRHHILMRTSDRWGSPQANVGWARGENEVTVIPASVLRHGPGHRRTPPGVDGIPSGSRADMGLLVEYLFDEQNPLADSSGNGFHLLPDPRVTPRSPNGVTFVAGGSLYNEQPANRVMQAVKDANAFSLEADFTYEREIDGWSWRDVLSLTRANWGHHARIMLQHNNIVMRIEDPINDENYWLEYDDGLIPNQRTHVVGTWDGSQFRLYVNGILRDSVTPASNFNIRDWDTLANLAVGGWFSRRHDPTLHENSLPGTVHAAAIYNRVLSEADIEGNRLANQSLAPNPDPITITPFTFPRAGTTAAALDEAHHLLNRLAFGPSIEDLNSLLAMGADAWIEQQLNPQTIDESELEALLASGRFRPHWYDQDLEGVQVVRAVLAKRQLLEVMTYFWENHFNTQAGKVENYRREVEENERFRALALSDFKSLLTASATGYPMTIYLDSAFNVVGAPNENYAREIMELHSLGANNGYTQDDIVEVARAFTGWSVRGGEFYFNPGLHDYAAKNPLGLNLPAGGGMEEGLAVIDHLVNMQECADFISWKLVQYLVADTPPQDVVDAASAAFTSSNGDIEQVLRAIIGHEKFRTDENYRGNKTKTPLEFTASALRITEAYPTGYTMAKAVENMGQHLHEKAEPTGFPEEGVNWINSNSLLSRWNLVDLITSNRGNSISSGMSLPLFIERSGADTADELLDLFSAMTTHGHENPAVRQLIKDYLTDGTGSITMDPETVDTKVRRALSAYLRLPEFNKQ